MFSLSLAVVLSQPATLTFSCPATRIERLVVALSEKTGETLKVASPFEGRFVVVRFKDTPVEEALARIGKSLGGQFVTEGTTKTLRADPASKSASSKDSLRKALEKYLSHGNDTENWTLKDADKLVSDSLALDDSDGGTPEIWKVVRRINDDGAQHRLLRRVIRTIGEKELADIAPDFRVVYSSRPTRMQRPLSQSIAGAVDQFARESRLQKEALQKRGFTDEHRPEMRYFLGAIQPDDIPADGFQSVTLIVKRSNGAMSFDLNLQGKDFTVSFSDQAELNEYDPKMNPNAGFQVDGDFKPSEMSILVGKALMNTQSGQREAAPLTQEESNKVKTYFKDLETNELLQLAPSELLLQTAEALDKDMAAEVEDMSSIVFAMSLITGTHTLQSYFNQGFSGWNIDSDEKGLTLTTSDAFALLDFKLPRRAVSRFVQEVDKKGLSIDAVADLVAATPKGEAAMFALAFGCLPFADLSPNSMITEGQSVLRAYALLDASSRIKAHQGGYSVQFRALTPALQKAVESYVYFESGNATGAPVSMDSEEMVSPSQDPSHDTTTLFPNGIPPDTIVTFRVQDVKSLFTVTSYGSGSTSTDAVSEDAAASRIAMAERMGQAGPSESIKLAQGTLKQLDMAIQFAPSSSVQGRYRLMPTFSASQVTDVDGLPDEVKKSLKIKLNEQREMYKNIPIGGRQGKIKP